MARARHRTSFRNELAVAAILVVVATQAAYASSGTISTLIGIGPPPPGPGVAPKPTGVELHDGGLYVSDEAGNQVLRFDLTAETVTVVAGTGGEGYSGDGGPATLANLDHPTQLAFDAAGNLYIADGFCDRIRRVSTTGIITTVAGSSIACGLKLNGELAGDGGPATSAKLLAPHGIAVDAGGNLFIGDAYNHRIRRVDVATGIITSFAGSGSSGFCCNGSFSGDGGPAATAGLYQPVRIAFDHDGNLFFSDSYNQRVRRIEGVSGVISTVAGTGTSGACAGFGGDGGPATAARFCHTAGLEFDGVGNLYVTDYCNSRVRRIDAASGIITTVAGTGPTGSFGNCVGGPADDTPGPATSRMLQHPADVAVASDGTLYIADYDNHRIRTVDQSGTMTTLWVMTAPSTPRPPEQLSSPRDVAVDAAGNRFVADSGHNRVVMITPAGIASDFAGTTDAGYSGDGGPATAARLNAPSGLTVDAAGNVYIADTGNHVVRRVTPGGVITTVAGDGTAGARDGVPATAGQLNGPRGLAWDGFNLYIADAGNHAIRRVDRFGVIMTFAGTGSPGFSGDGGQARMARLRSPSDVAVAVSGSDLVMFIADTGNHRIRIVDPYRFIATVTGNGTPSSDGDGGIARLAGVNAPEGVWLDGSGLWIADSGGFRVRMISGPLGIIHTVAGTGQPGFSGDGGPATHAQLRRLGGIVVDGSGDLYIADSGNHRIRKVDG